jgi:hypothetical protein
VVFLPINVKAQAHFLGLGFNMDFTIEEGNDDLVMAGDIRYQFIILPLNDFSAFSIIPDLSIGSIESDNESGFYIHVGIFGNVFFPFANINAGGQFYFKSLSNSQSIGIKFPVELELFMLPFLKNMNSPVTYSIALGIRPDIPIIGEGLGFSVLLGFRVYLLTYVT